METKDILSFSISIISTIIAIYALIVSHRASKKAAKIESSNILSEIHDKIRNGRQAMRDIFDIWLKEKNKRISPDELLLEENNNEKEDFIKYYNKNFHRSPSGKLAKNQSDEIHQYLHQVHHLWERYENKEFAKEAIMTKFKVAIKMDKTLLQLFLEAHWREHKVHEKPLRNRFWSNVPKFIEEVDKLD